MTEFECIRFSHAKTAFLSNDFTLAEAERARQFHAGFPVYCETPLVALPNLAKTLGVKQILVKDESKRFGLNAFKVLGGSYAIGRHIASLLKETIDALPASRILSPEIRAKLGETVFVTATDGNHGRGVAWTARQLGRKAVVYLPKGTAPERVERIRAEGADAILTDFNYDEAVRLARQKAQENGWTVVQDTAWEGYSEIPLRIMQGYTTMGAEILRQLNAVNEERPTHVFLQAGVGSMAGAMAGFFSAVYGENRPFLAVVEPNAADCIFRTAKANDGTLHTVTGDLNTIMAGLSCGEPCSLGWDILKRCADAFLRCPDSAAANGMRALAFPVGDDPAIVSGESGAAAFGCVHSILTDPTLASIRAQLQLNADSRLLFISTEGDTDPVNYQKILTGYAGFKS